MTKKQERQEAIEYIKKHIKKGDTFVAGLVHYFVNVEPSISAAIPFANMCAGVVVEKFGTMQISNDLLKGEEDE